MKYVVLKDYIDRDGNLVKTAEIVDLQVDKFTAGLIEHGFIVKATIYDELSAIAARASKALLDLSKELACKFGELFQLDKEEPKG